MAAELQRGGQVLEVELRDDTMYGPSHENTEWRRYEARMDALNLSEEYPLVKRAHDLLEDIGVKKTERFSRADERASEYLTDDDRRDREQALPAVAAAVKALNATQEPAP